MRMLQELKTLLLAAINLVMKVKLLEQQKLLELKNFFPETITVRSSFFLADLQLLLEVYLV